MSLSTSPDIPDLATLIDWFQTLSPASIARVGEFYAADARFSDPFNTVRGAAAIGRIFDHMFAQLGQPRFTVIEVFRGEDAVMLTWHFDFLLGRRALRVEGASRLRFDANGLIGEHDDFWDAASGLQSRLPFVGPLQRWLLRRLASPT